MSAHSLLIIIRILGLILCLPLVVVNGWVLSVLWDWFIFPVFGLEIGVYQAIGLMIVIFNNL